MAWDGTTQLFGWRESTWELRMIIGSLFGLGSVWFALPLLCTLLLKPVLRQGLSRLRRCGVSAQRPPMP